MGRLPRQAREARLTEPLWHHGPLSALREPDGRSVAWSIGLDSEAAADALKLAGHTDRDLADFAAAPDAAMRLLRRRLTRVLLARIAGVSPGSILFGRSSEGAPSVLSPKGWHVSVAGQAPLCVIAVARQPLGCDVEPHAGSPPLWDMLTPVESEALALLPHDAQPREWLCRWTAKEAHAKRLGTARHADPAAIETRPAGAGRLLASSAGSTSLCLVRVAGGGVEAVAVAAP